MSSPPTIPEFFNKSVFITGGTGFIGKVLVEKLLRSCPGIKHIYLLMREKKGRPLETRVKEMLDVPLFDVVRSQSPDVLKKVKAVGGNVSELGLGVSLEDQERLIQEVNVIFHVAASVRFDDSLTDAIFMNTRGTREVVALALQMKNLEVLVHVSTTYCNTDKKVIEEKLYPPHADWKKTIEIAERIDRNVLNALTEKYIHPLPNTYTFTKSLAEHVVYDLCQGRIPAVIYRPSVVLSSDKEPIPGWIDSLNGPLAVIVGCSTGVMRTVYGDGDNVIDCVPVDLLVKSIITSAWRQATFKDHELKTTINIYNGSNCDLIPCKLQECTNLCAEETKTVTPLQKVVWYPRFNFDESFLVFYFKLIFYQLLPAVLFDFILKLFGKKPLLVKLQRKIYISSMALSYFTHNKWDFINDKCLDLNKHLLPSDCDSFQLKPADVDSKAYSFHMVRGIKKFILKEEDDFEKCQRNLNRLRVAVFVFNTLWYTALFWIVFIKVDIISMVCNAGRSSWLHLTE